MRMATIKQGETKQNKWVDKAKRQADFSYTTNGNVNHLKHFEN